MTRAGRKTDAATTLLMVLLRLFRLSLLLRLSLPNPLMAKPPMAPKARTRGSRKPDRTVQPKPTVLNRSESDCSRLDVSDGRKLFQASPDWFWLVLAGSGWMFRTRNLLAAADRC